VAVATPLLQFVQRDPGFSEPYFAKGPTAQVGSER
jgi:hypothetical protein